MSYRAFVYKPYYYYFEEDPYFESRYITKNDVIEDKNESVRLITLKNGSSIEAFNGGFYNIWFLIFIFLVFLIFIYVK